ncbi:peptide deformylase [Hugonella massiliensis]|uniref:peptide deformylase n=1 Tax=Hugonella massiliensis TaxID=1720315 RepID=UPI00073E4143|nr:peptide deformylase [Hugonella massiliensis]
MIRPIVHMPLMLARAAEPATPKDVEVGHDLLDTLAAHRSECVGMAANMIGVNKSAIVFAQGEGARVMFNPAIVKRAQPFDTEEGCLSLAGTRPTRRYKRITVRYQDFDFVWREEDFTGWTAQIIQHEVDHTKGILI